MGAALKLSLGLALLALAAPVARAQADHIDEETGGHADRYADAVADPATDQPCDVLLSFAKAKTLEPLADGFQFAIDTTIDVTKPMADYQVHLNDEGRWTFAGAGLHELTGDFKDGVLLIKNAPKYFHVEAAFGPGGTASATIQRRCAGPQTKLIYVVDNPDAGVDGGDWLWAKG
ncbi:MAG TPA: hypothetical protein VMT68_12180 [Caulobacteraceae bacterium]|nr:hypothetical protein [Caulobacteraceae bacterium]